MVLNVELLVKDEIMCGPYWSLSELSFVHVGVGDVADQDMAIEELLHVVLASTGFTLIAIDLPQRSLIARLHLEMEVAIPG